MKHVCMTLIVAAALSVGLAGCMPLEARDFTRTAEGSYDVETRYDLSSLDGSMAEYAGAWAEPHLAIRDSIMSSIRSSYGSEIADVIANLYSDELARDIYSYIDGLDIAWLLDLRNMLGVIDSQMKSVDLQSTILLAGQGSGSYNATTIWNGITLFKNPDCKTNGGLLCDQIVFNFQDMLDSEYPLEVISSSFTAVENTAGALEMNSHELNFNYGRLGLYLLTNLALPDEPGDQLQLRDVVLAAINCRGLAGRLAGGDDTLGWTILGVKVGISLSDLIGDCQDGVFSVINDFVDQFNIPLSMNLSGVAQLFDDNRDGRIDRMAGGDFAGQVNASLLTGQSKEGDVTAKFTGFRVGDLPDDTLLEAPPLDDPMTTTTTP